MTDTTEFEPATTADLPAFDLAVRGYDREQVDQFVAELLDALRTAERTASTAQGKHAEVERSIGELRELLDRLEEERRQEPPLPSFTELHQRMDDVLGEARTEADDIRRRAAAERGELLAEARARAAAIVAEAQAEAEDLRTKAAHLESHAYELVRKAREEAADHQRAAQERAAEEARTIRRRAEEEAARMVDAARARAEQIDADGERRRIELAAELDRARAEAGAEVARLDGSRRWAVNVLEEVAQLLARAATEAREAQDRVATRPDGGS